MFRFLFRSRTSEPEIKTQREQFDSLVEELNEMIAELPVKPRVYIDPETGQIGFDSPERFSDETLALPNPDSAKTDADAPAPEASPAPAARDKTTEGDAVAKPKSPTPRPPVPRAPQPNVPTPRPPAG